MRLQKDEHERLHLESAVLCSGIVVDDNLENYQQSFYQILIDGIDSDKNHCVIKDSE